MRRFDYVRYDSHAEATQAEAKELAQKFETMIEGIGKTDGKPSARAKALALTKLEECYAWVGKAVRDDQVARNSATVLNEERAPSGAV